MKKRIFLSMLLLTLISVLTLSVTFCIIFYRQLSSTVHREVRDRTEVLQRIVTSEDYALLGTSNMRLSIIAADGTVLYDDDLDVAALSNHADREEIKEALELGVGESLRFSNTLGKETYYYAILLEDGSVLRLAKTMDSIWGMFVGVFPMIFFVVLIMIAVIYFSAGRLTYRIVNPINDVNFETESLTSYDELAPFVQTILQQKNRIARQIADLQNRSDTITAIMENMSEGVILLNRQGIVLSVNKSAAEIFSIYDSADGKNILEILRNAELHDHMKSALSGTRSEMNFLRDERIFRVYFSPVTERGAIILFLDITEKALAESLRREFSANVSHELKTPLTTIYGNIEMIESGMVLENDKPQFYGRIKDEAARLITLIEDIIMLSQLDENSDAVFQENVDLVRVASEEIEILAMKAKEQNIAITISGAGSLYANRSHIGELFSNLISNAIKYNKPDGTVAIEISSIENLIKIIVKDTGIGIPKEEQNRVFERFYRVDKSRSKKTGGTGLGLAIVKHIVMTYGGKIELTSVVDEGTSIVVVFFER